MASYLNALLLRFEGVNGQDVPTPGEVAITWGVTAFLLSRLVK